MELLNYPEVFVIGDQAWIYDMEAGQPYPMRALFAVREGYTAAENIKGLTRNEQLQASIGTTQVSSCHLEKGAR